MYDERIADIRDLMDTFPSIPEALLVEYLQIMNPGLTEFIAKSTLIDGLKVQRKYSPSLYFVNGRYQKFEDVKYTSVTEAKCRCLRVLCEFLPSARKAITAPSASTASLVFSTDGVLYKLYDFQAGSETILSENIRLEGVCKAMKHAETRIAILGNGVNRQAILNCGIKFFCRVDENWNLQLLGEVPDDEVWNNVPEF